MKMHDYKGKKNLCSKRVREAHLRQRLSRYALATKLRTEGIPMEQDNISRIKIGTRSAANYEVEVIAETLNVSVQWLLEEEQKEKYFSKKELIF